MFIIVPHFFKDVLLNSKGIFSHTTFAFILQCLFAISTGNITPFEDFTFLPSPNLKLVFDGNVSISFSVFSVRLDLKFSNQICPATVLVHAVSITADLEASATKTSDLSKSVYSSVIKITLTSSQFFRTTFSVSLSN